MTVFNSKLETTQTGVRDYSTGELKHKLIWKCVASFEILRRIFAADLAIHDTYFLVAGMHYVVYTSGLMGFFAAPTSDPRLKKFRRW